MLVLIMSRTTAARTAVADVLADMLRWDWVHVADDFGDGAANRVDVLRARMAGSLAAGRDVVYSGPQLSALECRHLRDSLRAVELVRLSNDGETPAPLAAALTLDGAMSAGVLAATIRAVLRLGEDSRSSSK